MIKSITIYLHLKVIIKLFIIFLVNRMTRKVKTQTPQTDLIAMMEKLEETKIPVGYEREMIIIGNQAYSVLGKEYKLFKKIGNLPNGVFFAEGYTPRLLFGKRGILAIEFLKRSKTLMLKCRVCGSKILKGDKNCNFCETIV